MVHARLSREEILERFRACVHKLGRAPGMARFCKTAHVTQADVFYYWPRLGDLAKEVGAAPNRFNTAMPETELFTDFARVCLHLGKIPNRNELRIATRELGTRTHNAFERFGTTSAFDARFRDWLGTGPGEFQGILSFPGWQRTGRTKAAPSSQRVYPFAPFLPAGLQYLDALARGELSPHDREGEPVHVLFERKCGDAFRALGFEVMQLGQGKGRAPDLVALARPARYGVIIDAKSRKDGYVLATDDRVFFEYVTRGAQRLKEDGIEKAYLVIVGPSFRETDLRKLVEYLTGSAVRGITFILATALMRMVEDSIRERYAFTLADFEKTLFGNRILLA